MSKRHGRRQGPTQSREGARTSAGATTNASPATGRVRLLEELREVNQRLVIANLRAHEQAERLAEADRHKDEFLAMLAHEIRNPLGAIRNAVDVLKMKQALVEPELRELQDVIDRQVGHLRRLVDDLLDLSRVGRGSIELQKQRVEVADIIARAIETVNSLIDGRRQNVEVCLAPEPLRVEADPIRLTQIVANLLNNAAKFTGPGGHIRVTAQREGGEAVIRVRDTGIGISAEMLPKVFDVFVQADHSSARPQSGLGLGLTIARKLTDLHGGRIQASSAGLGLGSEFVVRLPVLQEAPRPASATGPLPEAGAEPAARRVLIVDDNRDAANALAAMLKALGHDVRVAYGGQGALEAAGSFQPQVILLDIGLPYMDGYEVARRLREAGKDRATLLVALTGYGQAEDVRRAKEAGFDHHLSKPATIGSLQALLASAPG